MPLEGMSLEERQTRYLELARKVAAPAILSKAEFAELVLLRDSLQRTAQKNYSN